MSKVIQMVNTTRLDLDMGDGSEFGAFILDIFKIAIGVFLSIAAWFTAKFFQRSEKSEDKQWERLEKLEERQHGLELTVANIYATKIDLKQSEDRILKSVEQLGKDLKAFATKKDSDDV